MNHALARQMLRQRPTRRLAPREGLHGLARRLLGRQRRFGLGLVLLQLEQLQLELVEQRAALRRLPEPFVPQPGDLVLELSISSAWLRTSDAPDARPAASPSGFRRRREAVQRLARLPPPP